MHSEKNQSNVPHPGQFISNIVLITSECVILEQTRTPQEKGSRKPREMRIFASKQTNRQLTILEIPILEIKKAQRGLDRSPPNF